MSGKSTLKPHFKSLQLTCYSDTAVIGVELGGQGQSYKLMTESLVSFTECQEVHVSSASTQLTFFVKILFLSKINHK